jgi:hypothetical protein
MSDALSPIIAHHPIGALATLLAGPKHPLVAQHDADPLPVAESRKLRVRSAFGLGWAWVAAVARVARARPETA